MYCVCSGRTSLFENCYSNLVENCYLKARGDMHLTEQQMTEAQLTEAQQRLRAGQRLREMKDNPWSEFNAHHCVMDGFEGNLVITV